MVATEKVWASLVESTYSFNPLSYSLLSCNHQHRNRLSYSSIFCHSGKKRIQMTNPSRGLLPWDEYSKGPCLGELFAIKRHKRIEAREAVVASLAASAKKGLSHVVKEKSTTYNVAAVVNVKNEFTASIKDIVIQLLDASRDATYRNVVLQLVSTEVDPQTMEPKLSSKAVLDWSTSPKGGTHSYKVEFTVDSDFGMPGAITLSNNYLKEFFLESISIDGFINFACNSWIQPTKVNSESRVFFSNKAYLPHQTPVGLEELRDKELRELRGSGNGTRLASDRIYDYDVYNDLGDPDRGIEFTRPTLGGEKNPHPRRCRTGRPPTSIDTNAESPASASIPAYVPRDEAFEESKNADLSRRKLMGTIRNIIPSLLTVINDEKYVYKVNDFGNLYKIRNPELGSRNKVLNILPVIEILIKVQESIEKFFKFDPPKNVSKDIFWGLRDDEFGQRALAGINPLNIEKLKVFPPVSKLDPSVHGAQESALQDEHIIGHLDGMSVQQALNEDKLFILDYHDMYIPFLDSINALEGRKSYATRTLFFLTPIGTLKPIATELSLPSGKPTAIEKHVLTPPVDATTNWIWQLGKAHVCSNDAGAHQLVNHWLRTHACLEPFIIAAHRQLSVMHPIFKLLHPHMRYTLKINAMARESLINAEGTIESFFAPSQYCMEIACSAYREWWRFDLEGLPADLIFIFCIFIYPLEKELGFEIR